jgi:ribosomal protein L24
MYNSHTATQPHSHTATQPHSHTATQPHKKLKKNCKCNKNCVIRILKMNMDMFKDFAKINISDKNTGNIKKVEVVKGDDNEKNIKKVKKIVHGKNVILIRGNYKGYNGFVYEHNMETCDVEVDDYAYVISSMYKNSFGDIVDKIDEMYCLKLKMEKNEVVVRLFNNQVSKFVCVYSNNMKRVVCVTKEYKKGDDMVYDIVELNMEYKKYYTNLELMSMLSTLICNDNYKSIIGKNVNCVKLNGEEFWMVMKSPENKSDVNYIGKFGKLLNMIPEQYLVKYKKNIIVPMTNINIRGDKVMFLRGPYKNKIGALKNVNGNNFVIDIDAICKKVSSHFIKSGNGYKIVAINPDDLFFKDIELVNGNYFQVLHCTNTGFIGIEKNKNKFIEREIQNLEIKNTMPGFDIVSDTKIMSYKSYDRDFEMDVINEEDEQGEEEEDIQEGTYNDEGDRDIVYESEVEMKNTFKDSERLEFVNRVLSKEDKNIMKLIEKCLLVLSVSGDSIKIYEVLEKTNNSVDMIKAELSKLSVNDWKTTDTKYMVACLVIYEIVRSGYNFSRGNFDNFIYKLYDTSFFKKGDINESIFINVDKGKYEGDCCFDLIRMDDVKRGQMKLYYKSGKVIEIVKMMMENCNIILQKWFGPVILSCLDNKDEIFPVSRKITEISKKFLTTRDILNNNITENANRIIWGPSSLRMIKIWKTNLMKKCDDESDEKLKSLYKFVIDNFERAPFVLREMEGNAKTNLELLQLRELNRAFQIFITKLKKFNDRVESEKRDRLNVKSEEKRRLSKKRNEIELSYTFQKKVKVCDMRI